MSKLRGCQRGMKDMCPEGPSDGASTPMLFFSFLNLKHYEMFSL